MLQWKLKSRDTDFIASLLSACLQNHARTNYHLMFCDFRGSKINSHFYFIEIIMIFGFVTSTHKSMFNFSSRI